MTAVEPLVAHICKFVRDRASYLALLRVSTPKQAVEHRHVPVQQPWPRCPPWRGELPRPQEFPLKLYKKRKIHQHTSKSRPFCWCVLIAMAEATAEAAAGAVSSPEKDTVRSHKRALPRSSFLGIDSWKFWAALAWVCLFVQASGTAYIGYAHLKKPDGSASHPTAKASTASNREFGLVMPSAAFSGGFFFLGLQL
jgi:hypothetical protein